MAFSRCFLEIDSKRPQLRDTKLVDLKRDAVRPRRVEGTVGIERIAKVLHLEACRHFLRSVGANRDYGKAKGQQLFFDFAQLTQLRIAVGSPTAAIENQQRSVFSKLACQIDRFARHGLYARRRYS